MAVSCSEGEKSPAPLHRTFSPFQRPRMEACNGCRTWSCYPHPSPTRVCTTYASRKDLPARPALLGRLIGTNQVSKISQVARSPPITRRRWFLIGVFPLLPADLAAFILSTYLLSQVHWGGGKPLVPILVWRNCRQVVSSMDPPNPGIVTCSGYSSAWAVENRQLTTYFPPVITKLHIERDL